MTNVLKLQNIEGCGQVSAPQNRVAPLAPSLAPMAALGAGPGAQAQATGASDLAALFECPVCFDYVLPPILQVS